MAPPQHSTPRGFWQSLLDRIRAWRGRHEPPVTDPGRLARFVRTRSAHVAQTSLYGYLRTRAGTRFPELFSNDAFVVSVNIAKWHVWLACVSDLAVHAGAQIRRQSQAEPATVARLMREVVESVLAETGVPAEAGAEYPAHADRVRSRVALQEWPVLPDDDSAFSQSPTALVHWAPIVDELKQLDEEIVRNSIRFRWQEVRRELTRLLDAPAVIAALPAGAGDAPRPGLAARKE